MLKNNSEVSAYTMSSCRLKAEALARALNSRIWPCTWAAAESSGDGMSANGADEDDDLYFDASPSPIEDEDGVFRPPRDDQSSAATKAGRAKLYELLQQHAVDDAIEEFYDVSEDTTLTVEEHEGEMCLEARPLQSSNCCDTPACHKIEHLDNREDHLSLRSTECCQEIETGPDTLLDTTCDHTISDNSSIQMGSSISTETDISIGNNSHNSQGELVSNEIDHEDIHSCSETELSCELNLSKNLNIINVCNSEESTDNILNASNESRYESELVKDTSSMILHDTEHNFPINIYSECEFESLTRTDGEKENNEPENDAPECDVLSENNLSETSENEPKLKPIISIEITEDLTSAVEQESSDCSDSRNNSPRSSRLQVFDEERPMITRSTSLKTGKTPPGTPRKKIVRFADVLGLDLEDVRHIMTSDVPNIPSSAYTDLVLTDEDNPNSTSESVVLQSFQANTFNQFQQTTGSSTLFPMFAIPGQISDFRDRVRAQGICLESVVVSDLSIQCTCRVMNWGFRKKVIARYTVNEWASSNDIDATYVVGSTENDMDSFSFNIFLSPFHKNVKFALCYEVNGKEYWDSNRGENYCFGYHGDGRTSPASSPSWQHQFW